MAQEQSDKILIIGGGLGGLTLAQILWANKVPFELFERDKETGSRKQGWAVALVESLPALEELLPKETSENLTTTSVNHNTGEPDAIAFVDAVSGKRAGIVGGVPKGQPGYFLRVSRERLRTYLWTQNNLPITSGKQFTHYEEDANGVTAHFKDGTSTQGRLLIGADGLHSTTLNQLIGESSHRPVLSNYVPIFGEVTLPPSQYEPLRAQANSTILASSPGIRLQLGLLEMARDKSSAAYFWAVMIPSPDPTTLSDWLQTASKQEIYTYTLEATKHLHHTMRDLIIHGGPDAIVTPPPKFVEFVPPPNLPSGRVTVLGDSAHAMVPFRGEGANTAILDACDLGRLLVQTYKAKEDPVGVLQRYHEVMLPRGREMVLSSRAAGMDGENQAENWNQAAQRPE